jgi:hypothetical protein
MTRHVYPMSPPDRATTEVMATALTAAAATKQSLIIRCTA